MIGWMLYIFFVLLPLSFALSVTEDFDVHSTRVYVPLLGLMWIAMSLFQKKLHIPRGVVSFVALSFLMLLTASILWSEVPVWSARKILYFWSFVPLYFLVVATLKGWRELKEKEVVLTQSIVIGGTIASLIGIMQFTAQFFLGKDALENLWLAITPFFLGGTFSQSVAAFNSWFVHVAGKDLFRAIAFFPDPHVFAFYSGMILPFAYGLWKVQKVRVWLVCFAIILIANMLTFSRGGEIGLVGGGIIAATLAWPRTQLRMKHGLVALIALLVLAMNIPNPVTQRFFSSFSAQDTSNTSRIEIWHETLEIWSQYPLLGVGLGAYPYAVDQGVSYRTPIYAHNIFLDIGVELGIIGLILFLILILRMLYIFYRSQSIIGLCAIISVSIFLTHGVFDTPLFSVHVFPIILFLIGLATHYEQALRNRHKQME